MPETLITKDPAEVAAFRREFGDIIVKPLYGNGGAGIFHLGGDRNLSSLLEMFGQMFREPFIVQRYLKDVRKGDKRIILIDGEPAGAINRVPAEHDSRSNMHVGGRAEKTELTEREREICARIGPSLKERGFILVGIDVIGDYMTEINVTSPTGVREVKRFGGADIAALFWDASKQNAAEFFPTAHASGLKFRLFSYCNPMQPDCNSYRAAIVPCNVLALAIVCA
jgi:glutathione synthase